MRPVTLPGERWARPLGLACVLLFLFGVIGLVAVDPSSQDESRLVSAAAATARTGTARVAMTSTVSVAGSETAVKGEGIADFAAEKSLVTMQLPDGSATKAVTVGKVVYLQGAGFREIAQGKPWVSLDTSGFAPQGFGSSSGGGADVLASLRALEDEGVVREVREVGTDEVRGVRAVHYVGELDPEALLRTAGRGDEALRERLGSVRVRSATVEVWVSDDDLVRRMAITTSMTAGTATVDSATAIEFYDFGIPVQVDVPPADQVHRLGGPTRTVD